MKTKDLEELLIELCEFNRPRYKKGDNRAWEFYYGLEKALESKKGNDHVLDFVWQRPWF